MAGSRTINDAPADTDLLGFKRYVDALADIITDPETQTPLTIGIFGRWGAGKSTLLRHLRQRLVEPREGFECFCVEFDPWLYRDESNLIPALLHAIEDQLRSDAAHRLGASARKIGAVLTRVGADLFLKTMTLAQVSVKDLEKHEKTYLAQQRRARSAVRTLRRDLERVVTELTSRGREGRLVILVDNLDRCQPDQIVSLLESIKLFLDVSYCVFVLAVDDDVIHRGIQIRYDKFPFELERRARIGHEYLEKMIQLPLYLNPLGASDVEAYLGGLQLPADVARHGPLLAKLMQPNPRKIKRILNVFLLALAVVDRPRGPAFDVEVLARLIAVQVQEHDLYVALAQYAELAEYLGKVYANEIDLADHSAWAVLGDRQKVIRDLCQQYRRPGSWLDHVFKPKGALPPAAELPAYLGLLGQTSKE
jgi:hypothetical protein